MRNSLFTVILIFMTQAAWANVQIEHWQTRQGSRVYFVQGNDLPMVDIQVVFDAGSARDGKQSGISALTSKMLDTGAGSWDADTIAQRFENVGTQFGSGISLDMAWVSLRTLTEKKLFDKALETAQVILSDPKFNQQDFQREKKQTLAALKRRQESPGELASLAFYKALYGDHPYASSPSGYVETVSALTADDLRTFYKKHYVSANAIVVIVGDVNRQQAEKIADKLLANLPKGQPPEPLPEVKMPKQGEQINIKFPSQQTHVLSGLPGTYRKDADYFPLYVGNHILGGSSLVSLLFKEVREKRGLAYSAYSYFSPMLRKGPFTMGLQTRNDQTEQAVQVMRNTLSNFIEQGPTEAELLAAKKNITGGFVLRFDTNNELSTYVAMIGFYQMPLDYLDTFQEKVEAVTVQDIQNAFQQRIDMDLLQTVTVGNS